MIELEEEKKINKLVNRQVITEQSREKANFRDVVADKVSEFGGSWTFIFGFSIFFVVWILLNLYFISWDTYPFILLNLILSCLAVFQAPFILMSQNRMSEIDRKRDERAYKIALKAELEIKLLHEKIDKLLEKN